MDHRTHKMQGMQNHQKKTRRQRTLQNMLQQTKTRKKTRKLEQPTPKQKRKVHRTSQKTHHATTTPTRTIDDTRTRHTMQILPQTTQKHKEQRTKDVQPLRRTRMVQDPSRTNVQVLWLQTCCVRYDTQANQEEATVEETDVTGT